MVISSNSFPYHLDFTKVDFRKQPELYRIGVGEQGVLLVEPYKSEILPIWRFRTVDITQESAEKIWQLFEWYLSQNDFVGADMARKYLQMWFTRARRYANHKWGKKYKNGNIDNNIGLEYPYSQGSPNKENTTLPQLDDAQSNEKAKSADIFKTYWFLAKDHPHYIQLKEDFRDRYYEKQIKKKTISKKIS